MRWQRAESDILTINVFGMSRAAQDCEQVKITQFNQNFSGQPQRPAGDAACRLNDFFRVSNIAILPDTFGFDS